ncbi:hypothetical protein Hden_1197 [Hyphomicrobium denitrificans ATCC 51888]|uniref:Uncharacterized protein n=1 Tax=Hyphomicrobium denitrificans (strain ATCC 51888 / DSM 1869 / NCIMB 11706 / TK 0415) TaxID=582899 RepID=D8JVX1_HYPDA|nr:hypothetical protein [Hyphomicrobium denitrificans]ADJ23010.1 hypothetical protein Hden_1197 [Hyphomicrobium denitrificans ATCC 51888]
MKFEIGKTYSCRSICDYDCVFSFTVVGRSAAFVSIRNSSGKVTRRKVRVSDGVECIEPHGSYSMSPVLRAQ